MSLDWTNGKWLKGPETADWLENYLRRKYDIGPDDYDGISTLHMGETIKRAMYDWRYEGRFPTIWSLDRMLAAHGGHVSELPDALWAEEGPTYGFRTIPVATKREAARLAQTLPASQVADRLGVSAKSVRKWRREEQFA